MGWLLRSWVIMIAASLLASCATSGGGHSEFYIWVDETGQLRTERREQIPERKSEVSSKNQIDESEFVSSEVVDARLRDRRLFAWQDESGKQNVEELEKNDSDSNTAPMGKSIDQGGVYSRELPAQCCHDLLSLDRFLWNDLAGRELKLADYYQFVEFLNSDALVLDFSRNEVTDIRIKTFIKSSKVALPDIVILDERFNVIEELVTPYSHYVEESWTAYGFMQGRLEKDQLKDAAYLLILPSKRAGVLELDGNPVTLTDLGFIMVQRDAPSS